jgi:VWFA-related protein
MNLVAARVIGMPVLCWLAFSPCVNGQVTFSASVNTVATYVTVVSDDGALVSTLSAKDFEIRDNGKTQPISIFQTGSLPITIVMLLDNSASMRTSQSRIQAGAAALIRLLRPSDRATLGVFSRTVRLDGALTSDQTELLDRLHSPSVVMAGTALWDAVNAGMAALDDESGRRVVLMLSDGDDNSSETEASTVVGQATRDGVMIYSIGIRGGEGHLSKRLVELARETGGWSFELKSGDDLGTAFERVAEELHNQYLLGFSIAALDGKVHQLEVKVKRSGVTARSRKSYVALPRSAVGR